MPDPGSITFDQAAAFGVLIVALVLFVWGRWRYDVVAFTALVAAVLFGLVPADAAFDGFGHPAVVTVALVLALSGGLSASGAVDWMADRTVPDTERPLVLIAALGIIAATLSAFMNNVGALALLMPVAIQAGRRAGIEPSRILMPVSFASILGGMTTMIGTPPNIVIATYRAEAVGAPFAMFDFTPVGLGVAIVGVLFVTLIGRHLIPKGRQGQRSPEELFDISPYVTELLVPEGAKAEGRWLNDIDRATEEAQVVGLIRADRYIPNPGFWELLHEGDVVLLRGEPADIERVVNEFGLELAGEEKSTIEKLDPEKVTIAEAVVMPRSRIEHRTARELRLRHRFGLNLLAVSRAGYPVRERLRSFRFAAGDVLLLQGEADRMPETLAALGLVPLAERGVQLRNGARAALAGGLFAAAVTAAALGVLPITVAFALVVLCYVFAGILTLRRLYDAIDWPVLVLLGAMIPVGGAVHETGAAALLAGWMLALTGNEVVLALVVVLVLTMTLSDVMNNAATALVMAPISIAIAGQLGVNADPFLMAVAIGASCAFLTPIGHQNNTLIMGAGGYHFGDYWRMGLPLQILVILVSVPLLLTFWPP